MAIQTTGYLKAKVTLTGDDKFVHDGVVVDEVWIVVVHGKPRSNACWFRGVEFYSGRSTKGRTPITRMPLAVRSTLLDVGRALPERLP